MDTYIERDAAVSFHDSSDIALIDWIEHNYYWSCAAGAWFMSESERDSYDSEYPENDDDENCSDLYGYHDADVIDVHGWPKENKHDALVFGVELEMEGKRGYSQSDMTGALGGMNGHNGRYILMADGSLSDAGVELITVPMTLEQHSGSMMGWDKILAPVREIGRSGAGTTSCGMHVHVNRAAVSALTLGKMLTFIGSPDNLELVERVAQRSESSYAKIYKKKVTDNRKTQNSRYEALNIGQRTIEFRIFRGNLRTDRVMKNIEFCHSVVTYCQQASIRSIEAPLDYITWLGKRRSTYPNLVAFLGQDYGFRTGKNAPTGAEEV
jgi:hypothetical protein